MSSFEPHQNPPNPGIATFIPSSSDLAHLHLADSIPTATAVLSKKRRMSKSKPSPILKRAVSTPQMNSLAESGGLSPSALDKRRNKLGYQRISIACGHCRRRKIRCVLADRDEAGRCQNCIRLKKDCVFYPVESAVGPESRAHTRTGLGSKASSVISNSPSDGKSGINLDPEREFGRFPPLASNAPSDMHSVGSGSGLGISTGTPSISTSEFAFDTGINAREPWQPGMFQAGELTGPDGHSSGPWRMQDSPRVDEYSPYPQHDGHHGASYANYQYPHLRGEYGMVPLRSMSYGNIEPVIGAFQPGESANSLDFTRHTGPAHYPLPSSTESLSTQPITTTSMLESPHTPVATEAMSSYGMYTPQWSYYRQQQQAPQQQQPPHQHHLTSMEYPRHDSVSMQWYHPSQPPVGPGMDLEHVRQQQTPSSMPPPGAVYGKAHHA